jgi:hypothetical protein
MDDALNPLPTTRPLLESLDAIRAVIDKGIPDIDAGLAGKALRMTERFLEIEELYPSIGRYVHQYHPDIQGPMDLCEMLVGSRLFMFIYDAPDLIHELLKLVTATYIEYLRRWFLMVPPAEHSVHWSMMHGGTVMLRDDSAMNFSPDMFDEFIRPYDQMILDEFGGGAIHFCGRGDHYIESMSMMSGLSAIAMSQPHLNDMERIFANTVDKGIKLIGFSLGACPAAEDRDLRGRVHGQ